MSLPDQPPTFREPTPSERPWVWRLLGVDGSEIGAESERFVSQADAESWLGEEWQRLVEEGVETVVLLEIDREVYGPMALTVH
ncbi:hypothetical protein [Nocardioides acrostichi]|uniref:Uncharacterized protein n=1 Tax=Nocardioides acrostichi TaxID=2784339 RepID=A0A930UWS6_9ACTN|nr:hypothetical protein [Nocardioides acrostichi]MBF4162298.1 hypothetical protein [Nocardioides acrostichi]